MSLRHASFRWCMVIGACALLGVAVYYLVTYVGLNIAVTNAGLTPFYQEMIRALWIGYCLQASLLGVLFIVAALRPHWISRPLIVICGLLPLAEAVLGFSFTGSYWLMMLLAAAAVLVLVGAMLWPTRPVPLPLGAPDRADATANAAASGVPPAAVGAITSSATVPPP